MHTGQLDGYRGIWFELRQRSALGDKYSGGLGTYTAKHVPMAVHAPQVNKTFFVYGGTPRDGQRHLLAMASYYDHALHRVPRPTVVYDKQGVDDPHDNPSINLDEQGHLWVFVSGRMRFRPGFIYRSVEPFSVDRFERVYEGEFTYPQPWWIEGEGFLHLHTMYTGLRELYWSYSSDGTRWSAPCKLAGMEGHYQTSRQQGGRIITAFNRHPQQHPDNRTDLYFVQTTDSGATWRIADGSPIDTPLVDPACAARVKDYASAGRLVYMKDIAFDAQGNPVILYVTSSHHAPGPQGDPRKWVIAKWGGSGWSFHDVTQSTHNYDTGSLDLADDASWRIVGPTEPGPQHWGTGGEIAVWLSNDRGETWRKSHDVTRDSERNHGYVRRPIHAADPFDAFWADGNPDTMSPSRLYFTNRAADAVYMLPDSMPHDYAEPQRV